MHHYAFLTIPSQGITGHKGDPGLTGVPGMVGDPGPKGNQGPQGLQGDEVSITSLVIATVGRPPTFGMKALFTNMVR